MYMHIYVDKLIYADDHIYRSSESGVCMCAYIFVSALVQLHVTVETV